MLATSWPSRREPDMADEESQIGRLPGGLHRLGSGSVFADGFPDSLVPPEEEEICSKHVHWSASTTSLTGLLPVRDVDELPDSRSSGEYAKSIVYGGLDAIVTSFALVASVSGYGLGSGPVLVLGFATLVANGMFMGFGHYSTSKAEAKVVPRDDMVADWDAQLDLHTKAMILLNQCERNGMEASDAMEVRKIFQEFKDLLEEQVIKDEDEPFLSLQDEVEDEDEAWKTGIVRFMSFLCFGSTPLLSFVVLQPFTESDQIMFLGACVATGVILMILGLSRALLVGEKVLNTTAGVLLKGAFAGFAAYGISYLLAKGLGIE